jgi:hypothetical protein
MRLASSMARISVSWSGLFTTHATPENRDSIARKEDSFRTGTTLKISRIGNRPSVNAWAGTALALEAPCRAGWGRACDQERKRVIRLSSASVVAAVRVATLARVMADELFAALHACAVRPYPSAN